MDGEFTFLISNMLDDQAVWVNLPDYTGLPDGVLVDAESHYLNTWTYSGSTQPTFPISWPITRPGDADWDGSVDGDDYDIIVEEWGDCDENSCQHCRADFNNSGAVDWDDLYIWQSNLD